MTKFIERPTAITSNRELQSDEYFVIMFRIPHFRNFFAGKQDDPGSVSYTHLVFRIREKLVISTGMPFSRRALAMQPAKKDFPVPTLSLIHIWESKDKFKTLQKARRTSKEGFFTPLSQP